MLCFNFFLAIATQRIIFRDFNLQANFWRLSLQSLKVIKNQMGPIPIYLEVIPTIFFMVDTVVMVEIHMVP